MVRNIIVIGSGAAGMTAASTAKRSDPDASVLVFTKDEYVAYSPCAIPWAIEGKIKWEDIVMHDPSFYKKERGIDVYVKTTVTAIDGVNKAVVANGETYRYDSLIIATGGIVSVPPVDGTNLEGVFTVKTIKDGKLVQTAARDSKTVVIVGAGIIGLEMSLAFRRMGKRVIIVEVMSQVMSRIVDDDMADLIQKHLEGDGIEFIMETSILAVRGIERVEAVVTTGGEYLCDMVVFATGVRADLSVPGLLGLDVGQLKAVVVAPTMQPYKMGCMVSDVFVAGDVVQCQSAVMKIPVMSQLGSTAVRQGIVAGMNAAGCNKVIGPVVSPWVSVIGSLHVAGSGFSRDIALRNGIKTVDGKAVGFTCARYCSDKKKIVVKIIADVTSHKIIGAQIVSGEDVTGRINWLASAIMNGMTVEDFIANSETAYCPLVSTVRDVVILAANELCSRF
ncbi:MAG: FAD-dependent oxidoreductase [archaeon]|nr:FAD-dependent oxidoreductase [archaeon]